MLGLYICYHGILNNMAPMLAPRARSRRSERGRFAWAWELISSVKADLVVLSACETARGRYGAGEGIIGLSWALFVAGCLRRRQQWKVEAASSARPDGQLHRPLARPRVRVTRAEALRQAG